MATKHKVESGASIAARNTRLRRGTTARTLADSRKHKTTLSARESLAQAFERLGGVTGLVTWGRKNPDEFYKLWGRLVPKEVSVGATGSLEDLLAKLAAPDSSEEILDADYNEIVPLLEHDSAEPEHDV